MEYVKCPECGLKIRKDWAGKPGVVCTRVGHVYKNETDIPVQTGPAGGQLVGDIKCIAVKEALDIIRRVWKRCRARVGSVLE